jgi:hydrogenase/urease accessory protein HupE
MGYGLLIMSIHLSSENVVAVARRFGLARGVPSGGAARAGG